MSGLIKQVLGTLGVFMLIVGHSHAQNTPTQNTSEQNTPNSQAAPSSVQSQPNMPANATDRSANGAIDGHSQARPNNVSPNDANSNNAQVLPPINNSQNPHQLGNNVDQGNPVGQAPSQAPSQTQSNSAPQSVAQPLPPINMDSVSDADLNSTEPVQDNSSSSALTHEPTSPVGVDASTLPHDLSPYGMFMQADFVVKAVMIGLASASLLTWVIFVAKTLELGIAKAKMRSAVRQIVAATSLAEVVEQFANKKNVSGRLVNAAANEVRMSINAVDGAGSGGVKERVTSALSRIEAHAGRRMAGGSAILATIGSISPFVGLFGTVWGIMNAFIGISKSQVTNLAVVAPGIAEALLATAIGLVAAIPAVVIYNYLAKSIVGYRQIVSDASTGIERLVSRDLDFREAQRKSPRTVQPLAAE